MADRGPAPRPRNGPTHAPAPKDFASPDAMNSACRLDGPTRAAASVDDSISLTGGRSHNV